MKEKDIPKAPAILKKGRDNYLWIITECPLCGHKNNHIHDGGSFNRNPREYLGQKTALCISQPNKIKKRGYNLVEADPELTDNLLKK